MKGLGSYVILNGKMYVAQEIEDNEEYYITIRNMLENRNFLMSQLEQASTRYDLQDQEEEKKSEGVSA